MAYSAPLRDAQRCLPTIYRATLCYRRPVSSAHETDIHLPGTRTVQSSLKDEIVRVAVELGTELGEDGLTMRGIASRLGVSATALYQHFEGKASILRAIRFHGLAMINDVLGPCFEQSDPLESIASVSRTYIQFARDNPWLYGVLFTGDGIDYSALSPEERELVFFSHEKVVQRFRDAQANGVIRDGLDIETAPLLIWAANHGLATLLINGRLGSQAGALPVDENALVENFVETSVRGFRRT